MMHHPRRIFRLASVKKSAVTPTGTQSFRLVAVGDTIIREQGLVAIIIRDPRYDVAAPEVYALN